MSVILPDSDSPKKQRTKPSKEDAAKALTHIKEKEVDENFEKIKLEKIRLEQEQIRLKAEKAQQEEIERKIKKKLQENLKKKEEERKRNQLINFLESGQKIKWKAINSGQKFQGYIDDKFIFEIKRGLTVFSLYIKGKNVLDKNKKTMQGMHGTSANLSVLKEKAEKILLKLS
jgi:hypothetical protein